MHPQAQCTIACAHKVSLNWRARPFLLDGLKIADRDTLETRQRYFEQNVVHASCLIYVCVRTKVGTDLVASPCRNSVAQTRAAAIDTHKAPNPTTAVAASGLEGICIATIASALSVHLCCSLLVSQEQSAPPYRAFEAQAKGGKGPTARRL